MKAAADILPQDVQKLFGEVEDYLENLQSENLSARARIQRDEILFDIEQLKERYQWGFLPGDENSRQKATEDQEIILKQGYLEKRTKDSKIFGSEWQRRWCVLDNTAFYYYANEKSKQPKGIFAIENYHAQLVPYLRKDSRRDCCFELTSPGKRTYEFTAANPAEAIDWVDHITFLLKDMNSFIIPCEEEEEEEEEEEKEKDYSNTDKEEAYDDIESFDTPSVTFSQDFTLDLDKEEPMVQEKECIYEVLPDEDHNVFAQDDRENAGDIKNKGFIRRYANYYQSLWDCTGGHQDELSFQRGDLIYIISKEYNMYGWWVGELNNMVGIVPRNYLMPAYDLEE
ncbi:src kinase-associated phosphoprotein 1 [Crotalus tigris]|uniref:src kinase-associated phosphoprotein 1 n=1 Tax=Crotalus tigris TaxID=88082 RepID=UPI00192F7863|nr:src kinase-associated phosphoprotein 1 [Crotalus tigris]XP_039189208.1 src kinase-associated phosphoprotein 1 [Crotalus tigris]XP_039189209.1 src kinase-associated phosphoprotein 1 [Crotalus tigris]XP_039189210.1 src kinase-associated phosphoprotein 1 [Crotalus tigris]